MLIAKWLISQMYLPDKGTWKEITRATANQIHNSTLLEQQLRSFFQQDGTVPRKILESFLPSLEEIRDWMSSQSIFRFYSSSLLFVYEGSEMKIIADVHIGDESREFKSRVKMIDFAHVFKIEDGGKDYGYVKG